MIYLYSEILFSYKKEWNNATQNNMGASLRSNNAQTKPGPK